MSKGRVSSGLPDIDDDVLKARLQPLADRVLPARASVAPVPPAGAPEAAVAAMPVEPKHRNAGSPAYERRAAARGEVEAARVVEETRAVRGPKKGVEFLLPDRVVRALKIAAAEQGVSMSVVLLAVLRDAGYPVIQEDFVDLRRLPRR